MQSLKLAATFVVLTFAGAAFAQHSGADGHHAMPQAVVIAAATAQVASRASGVVKKLDSATLTAVIAHEPIQSMGWPRMTMAFKVRDKALFSRLAAGAKVEFEFVQQGDDFVVTSLK